MKTTFIRCCFLLALLFVLGSWGEKAHEKINSSCVNYFPSELKELKVWGPELGRHASDPDNRKKADKNEAVKHFIDIDNYQQFLKEKKINTDFKAECAQLGSAFVMKNGTLPWVTDSTYKALVSNMRHGDWDKAMLTAADLGHYVGDGHMPLHITANYNGQLSDQKGIHARYEIDMIDRYIDGIKMKKTHVHKISNVQATIFGYLYSNYSDEKALLDADRKAYQNANNQFNDVYYTGLWNETGEFTTQLINHASQTLASFIYSAWLEAGKPEIPSAKHPHKRKAHMEMSYQQQ